MLPTQCEPLRKSQNKFSRKHIFSNFHDQKQRRGAGYGEIIEGAIHIESQEGQGTCVTLLLPKYFSFDESKDLTE